MDEGRKRVIGLMAAILSAMHMQRADDLFGMPNGSPITDRIIEASIQWAERIMQRIDSLSSKQMWASMLARSPQRNRAYDRRMMDAHYVSERLTSLKQEMQDLQDFNGRHCIRDKHTALDNSARASRQERLLQIKRELSDMLKRCA